MPQDQPLTGFEGVQDSLLYDTLQQAQYQQRVLQQRQIADPFDRAVDAFGGLLQIGVNELAPPLAERNARAVSTARANALRTVEGQEFDSPYLRQVAVVEAAADELDSQGLGSSAAQLRANALALRTQAMEFMKLQGEVDERQLDVERKQAEKPYWATNFASAAMLNETQAAAAVSQLDEQLAGMDDRLSTLKAQRVSAQGEAANVGLKRRELEARIESERLQASLARENLRAAQFGQFVPAFTAPGIDAASGMRQPDGSIRFTNPQTGKVETLPAGMYAVGNLTGSRGDIASPNSPKGQASARSRAFASLLATGTALRQNMRDNPNSRTFIARTSGLVDNLRSEVTTIQAQLPAEQARADEKLFDDYFRQNNINNAVQQAQIKALAYGFARVYEPSAPALSSADVERGAAQVGGENPTDAVTAAVLDESLRIQYELTAQELKATGQEFPAPLQDMWNKYRAIGTAARPAPASAPAGGLSTRRPGPPAAPRQQAPVRSRVNWNN